jgi:inosine/xanthosine triphosphatase
VADWRRVAVGSTNPAKVEAARAVFAALAPAATVVACEVASGVAAQPRGEAETRRGARLRAQRALAAAGADLGVGMEGGVAALAPGELWAVNWCAVATADGRLATGRGIALRLPPVLAARLAAGAELGEAIDALTGRRDVKRAEGTVGVLTAGLVTRADLWRQALAAALAPLLHPELYPGP